MSLYPAPEESGFYGHADKKTYKKFFHDLLVKSEQKRINFGIQTCNYEVDLRPGNTYLLSPHPPCLPCEPKGKTMDQGEKGIAAKDRK